MMSEVYQSTLYVPREDLFSQIKGWILSSPDDYPLWSLVGAAGIGKSWFMVDTYRRLRREYNPPCLPIWLDLSQGAVYPNLDDSAPEAGQPFPDFRTENGRRQWLENIINQVKIVCPAIVSYNPTVTFDSLFAKFTASLCQDCAEYNPILLVDGYDEIFSNQDREYLQEHIFAAFLSESCTHVLLARRDTYLLTYPFLRWNDKEILLTGFDEEQKKNQLDRRERQLQKAGEKAHITAQITRAISPYVTSNPYINTFLFKRAASNTPPRIQYPDDLEACIQVFATRAGLDSDSIALLKLIAQELPDQWSAGILNVRLGIKIDNKRLGHLFESGIISLIPGTARYQIESGIYRLFQLTKVLDLAQKDTENLSDLAEKVHKHFNEDELRHLCFEMSANYDGLSGPTLQDKARELVLYFARLNKIGELVQHCRTQRPGLF
jgi:hypothetical protein